jgi:hypothetical protein
VRIAAFSCVKGGATGSDSYLDVLLSRPGDAVNTLSRIVDKAKMSNIIWSNQYETFLDVVKPEQPSPRWAADARAATAAAAHLQPNLAAEPLRQAHDSRMHPGTLGVCPLRRKRTGLEGFC